MSLVQHFKWRGSVWCGVLVSEDAEFQYVFSEAADRFAGGLPLAQLEGEGWRIYTGRGWETARTGEWVLFRKFGHGFDVRLPGPDFSGVKCSPGYFAARGGLTLEDKRVFTSDTLAEDAKRVREFWKSLEQEEEEDGGD